MFPQPVEQPLRRCCRLLLYRLWYYAHTLTQTHTRLLTQLPVTWVLLSWLKPSPLVLAAWPLGLCLRLCRQMICMCAETVGVSRSWMISRWSESHFLSAAVSSCALGMEEGRWIRRGGGCQCPHTQINADAALKCCCLYERDNGETGWQSL